MTPSRLRHNKHVRLVLLLCYLIIIKHNYYGLLVCFVWVVYLGTSPLSPCNNRLLICYWQITQFSQRMPVDIIYQLAWTGLSNCHQHVDRITSKNPMCHQNSHIRLIRHYNIVCINWRRNLFTMLKYRRKSLPTWPLS